jgi:hypothetical protein
MKRFFFNLCGARVVDDQLGIRFNTDLQAFKAAERMARELAAARPILRGKAWIAVTRDGSAEAYCVAIRPARQTTRRRSIGKRHQQVRPFNPLSPNPVAVAQGRGLSRTLHGAVS